MSLNRTEKGISNLRTRSSLCLEDVLEFIQDFIDDMKDTNHIADAGEISSKKIEKVAEYYSDIVYFLNSAYDFNKDKIDELQDFYSECCEERATQIEECTSEMNVLNAKIKEALKQQEELEKQQEELEKQNEELEKARGHLRDVKEKNGQLLANIEKLSDPNLEKINEENKELEQNINVQTEKYNELMKKQEEIKSKLDDVRTLVESAENEIEQLNAEYSRQNEIMEQRAEEKKGLELGIDNIKAKINELEDWIKNVSTDKGDVNEKIREVQSEVNALLTAWNSFNNDKFCERIEDYTKISGWFANSFDEVQRKINEVEQRYSQLLTEAKKLMSKKENDHE